MDKEQFEQQAKRWRQRSYRTALSVGIDADGADDVAQDTLLKLWAMRHELDGYRSIDALVNVIARHLAIDATRRKHLLSLDQASAELPIVDNDADVELIGKQEKQQLLHRLAQLPQRQHQVLIMRQVEGRSYDEIAALLGIGTTSARVLLSRARKWLLAQYQQDNEK